jgi:hypothetical protein
MATINLQAAEAGAQAALQSFLTAQRVDATATVTWFAGVLAKAQPLILAATQEASAGNAQGTLDLQLLADYIATELETAQLTIAALENQQATALLVAFEKAALQALITAAVSAA